MDSFVDKKPCKEDTEKFNRLLVRAFVSGNIPYAFVDNPEFREMMTFIRPSLAVPTRQTLSGWCNFSVVFKAELKTKNQFRSHSDYGDYTERDRHSSGTAAS